MTTSVSRILSILCIMFKIIASFILALFPQLCVRVGILLPFGKHLCNRIISLRAEVSAHKASLTLSFVIEVPGQSQKIESVFVLGVSELFQNQK